MASGHGWRAGRGRSSSGLHWETAAMNTHYHEQFWVVLGAVAPVASLRTSSFTPNGLGLTICES